MAHHHHHHLLLSIIYLFLSHISLFNNFQDNVLTFLQDVSANHLVHQSERNKRSQDSVTSGLKSLMLLDW